MSAFTTPAGLTGAAAGLLLGVGLALVLWRLSARRIRLVDRVAPYLQERPTTSRLLQDTHVITPFPTLERIVRPVVRDVAGLLERLGSGASSIRTRLVRAGSPTTLEAFRTEQVIWATIGLAGGLLLALLIGVTRGVSLVPLVVLVALCAVGGALLRDQALTRQVQQRERRMIAEFPTIAELLALAVGAGESPLAALERVARSTRGELSAEIGTTLADMRSGVPLAQALDRMASRTALPSLARFTDGVATAVERGTPLAEVLRAQAQDVREAGHRALMEEGGRREVLMLVPVVFLMLPVTILFAVFPGLTVLAITL
ncbi:MAG TPA: type II secretion system F family protein [Actinotalea caeni]|uniref:type II secretion system F family protein n=1 Tax=Actinotalea caeni TaxID=1348467 RepID=UPI002B4B0ADA|nr:type II secretion system F family protein [Actinotalea caeni]HLV54712.1 type II secretion system F family protein [Actinotalea caeni]